jgi:hypothetical protein
MNKKEEDYVVENILLYVSGLFFSVFLFVMIVAKALTVIGVVK